MSESLFIRLLAEEDKAAALATAVEGLRTGASQEGVVCQVSPSAFSEIPGSPFAYWASDRIRRLFTELPPFEGEGRTVRVGLQTGDDNRFVRAWWEVAPERIVTGTPETTPEEFRRQTYAGKRWVPFAKGGEYSPYYADLHLVVNWERDGEEIRRLVDPDSGRQLSRPQNIDFFFRPGLTYTNSTTSEFSIRCLPAGAVFSHMGQSCFYLDMSHARGYLAVMNSRLFQELLDLQVALADAGRRHYEVGIIRSTPVPPVDRVLDQEMNNAASAATALKMQLERGSETGHTFVLLPKLLLGRDHLSTAVAAVEGEQRHLSAKLDQARRTLDVQAALLYGIPDTPACTTLSPEGESTEDDEGYTGFTGGPPLVADLLSYAAGTIFGRWDIRLATGQRPIPELPDPFAPLPACSPGMLTGPQGLPASPQEVPPDYPIPIQWDGIIPDDPGHPLDLMAQVRRVLGVLFPDRAPQEVEAEACEILGVRDLRSWFANQFFPYHVKRYSKSRRKAPIYWQLRSARKNYSIWLYYHRLTADTLWTVLRNYVDPKVEHEQEALNGLKAKLAAAQVGGEGREERRLVKEIQKQEQFLEELTQFRAQILEVANMGYDPDRDDGVLINIAPLHKLVPWSEATKAWQELQEGKFPWSTMHQRLGIGGTKGR